MDGFDLAQRHYLHEADRLAALNQSASVPLALITALLTGIIAMLTQATEFSGWAEITLVIFCGAALLSLLNAITHLVRASVGYRYALLGTVAEQLKWRDDFIAQGVSHHRAGEEFIKMLEQEYADCATVNALNNDRKAEYLEAARVYIVASVCILAVAAVPYLVIRAEKQMPAGERSVLVSRASETTK